MPFGREFVVLMRSPAMPGSVTAQRIASTMNRSIRKAFPLSGPLMLIRGHSQGVLVGGQIVLSTGFVERRRLLLGAWRLNQMARFHDDLIDRPRAAILRGELTCLE